MRTISAVSAYELGIKTGQPTSPTQAGDFECVCSKRNHSANIGFEVLIMNMGDKTAKKMEFFPVSSILV